VKRVVVASVVVAFAVAGVSTYRTSQARADARTIALGDLGAAVTQIQAILAATGYTVAVDGRFGPQTDRAVRAWQRVHRLTVDGIVGPVTWATLRPAVRLTPPRPRTPEEIIRSIFPPAVADRAVAIAFRESRFVPTAVNRNGDATGLFQIMWSVHRGWLCPQLGICDQSQLKDARMNTTAAYALYQRAGGFGPWNL